MPRNNSSFNKNLVVRFVDNEHAKNAFREFRTRFPSCLPKSNDLSKVSEDKVIIQENSIRGISRSNARQFLLSCVGAVPG